jgi:tetratricopeptide (TPR) repeat protein
MAMALLYAYLLLLPALAAADRFAGASACAACHPAQFEKQRNSRHAASLARVTESSLAEKLIGQTVREKSGLAFDYSRAPEGVRVTARRGEERSSAVLEWAFGAGAQGITPVGRIGNQFFEHRVSWFTREERAGLTIGHSAEPPQSIRAALGQPQSAAVIYQCFQCHATGVERGPDLSHMRPGIECERCHGLGVEHVRRPSAQSIRNPGRLAPEALIKACGECHRLPASGGKPTAEELAKPETVRFAPIGLIASRCFQASGKLSCLTCHDPHGDASNSAEFYASKCVGCHTAAPSAGSECRRAAGENCLPCHMPKSSPVPLLEFTDHRIRIARVSETSWAPVERAIAAGEFDRARQLLESIPARGSKWLLLSSRIYDGLNDPTRAVQEAQAAIEGDPRNLAAHLQLGQIFLAHNTPEPAAEIFSNAERIAPDSPLVHLGKGLALKDLQRFDQAEIELTWCLVRDTHMGIAFDALASMYLQMLDSEKLAALSRQYLANNPSDYRGYYYLAAAKEHAKEDPQETEKLLHRSIELNPDFAASQALLGKLLTQENRLDEAVQQLEHAVRLRPDYTPGHLYLGNAYRKSGREVEASREFQMVKELNEKQTSRPSLLYHRGAERK